jgi:hypothetical protein
MNDRRAAPPRSLGAVRGGEKGGQAQRKVAHPSTDKGDLSLISSTA